MYDEQHLLRPASVDVKTGYRYYRSDQVPAGRLIRTLRDMNLPLAQILQIVKAKDARAQVLLEEFAQQADRRYAREKRAFQAALASMRQVARSQMPPVDDVARPAMTVSIWPFAADRDHFVARYYAELAAVRERLAAMGLIPAGEPRCRLVDPLTDEEGQVEIVVPIDESRQIPQGVTIQSWSPARCAVVICESRDLHAADLGASLDLLFDWFERRGHRAAEPPLVAFTPADAGLRTEIAWAYEQATASGS